MSNVNKDSFTYFPICILLFLLPSLGHCPGPPQKMKSGHPCFITNLRGNVFRVSPLNVMPVVDFTQVSFSNLRSSLLCPVLFWMAVGFCEVLFLYLWRWRYSLHGLTLYFVDMVNYINFLMLNQPCMSRINLIWSWYIFTEWHLLMLWLGCLPLYSIYKRYWNIGL